MRVWAKEIIPYLCNGHLGSVWNEGLSIYGIIVYDKEGYRHHPATVEFENCPEILWLRLALTREERLRRGLKAKRLPELVELGGKPQQYQGIIRQLRILRSKARTKKCGCRVGVFNCCKILVVYFISFIGRKK